MKPLEWIDGRLRFLDQTKLPLEETYRETGEVKEIAEAIKRLSIRGAPLIGIAAAYAVALAGIAVKDTGPDGIKKDISAAIDLLASTRPTAVNLFSALERQRRVLNAWNSDSLKDLQAGLLGEAELIHREDEEMCERIGEYGVELLKEKSSVLTHCNTGMLATGGRGTALGIITKAWELKKIRDVYIDETRPLLQGARLTAWELMKKSIPVKLITDNTAAFLMQQGRIDAVIVGADRIASNGDTANKIGTYNLAVLAKFHGVPFYIAAPKTTIDPNIKTGKEIEIEERGADEVLEINGNRTAPPVGVYSPAFDVTPNELITAIISDAGVHYPPFCDSIRNI